MCLFNKLYLKIKKIVFLYCFSCRDVLKWYGKLNIFTQSVDYAAKVYWRGMIGEKGMG